MSESVSLKHFYEDQRVKFPETCAEEKDRKDSKIYPIKLHSQCLIRAPSIGRAEPVATSRVRLHCDDRLLSEPIFFPTKINAANPVFDYTASEHGPRGLSPSPASRACSASIRKTFAEIRRLVLAISGHLYTTFGHCQGPVCGREFTLESGGIRA